MVYTPFRQSPIANFRIIARSRSSEEIVANTLRHEVLQIDADLPAFNIMTFREFKDHAFAGLRILTTMYSLFAAIALVISVVGIYAVTAYSVGQRIQEIGVRMALGANRGDVVWFVLRLGLKQLAIGLPLGLAGAYGVSSLLSNALFNVTPANPLTFIAIPILLAITIILACMLPAHRAALLNPVDALRTE
jgi:ABC-type antimicrobial peptide transport system permease subunit